MHASMCKSMLIDELSLVYIDLNNSSWAVGMFLPMGHDPHGCTYPTKIPILIFPPFLKPQFSIKTKIKQLKASKKI